MSRGLHYCTPSRGEGVGVAVKHISPYSNSVINLLLPVTSSTVQYANTLLISDMFLGACVLEGYGRICRDENEKRLRGPVPRMCPGSLTSPEQEGHKATRFQREIYALSEEFLNY